jgi:hypothetical protein
MKNSFDSYEEIFIKWLVVNNIYGKFTTNCYKFNRIDDLFIYFKYIYPMDFLAIGFDYNLSPEGSDYWIELNTKWQYFYRKNIKRMNKKYYIGKTICKLEKL